MSETEKLYLIEGDGYHYQTGHLSDGTQVLAGVQMPEIVMVRFDATGKLLDLITHSPDVDTSDEDSYDLDTFITEMDEWLKAQDVRYSRITVHKFFVSDSYIGIMDLPHHYQEFLDNMENYSANKQAELSREVEQWMQSGSFVLWFTEDYFVGSDGDLESS